MKAKDEVLSKFAKSKALVENQIGWKIKVLRFDSGEEYTTKDFDAICRDALIKRKFTIPYNLQQNGVIKRKN